MSQDKDLVLQNVHHQHLSVASRVWPPRGLLLAIVVVDAVVLLSGWLLLLEGSSCFCCCCCCCCCSCLRCSASSCRATLGRCCFGGFGSRRLGVSSRLLRLLVCQDSDSGNPHRILGGQGIVGFDGLPYAVWYAVGLSRFLG